MITLEVADRVATVTLDDPRRRNIVSSALNASIIEAMDELESRDDVGALVVTVGRTLPAIRRNPE
jgi:enoyl-CoA hydratase